MANRKKGKLVVKVGNWWSCGQDDWMTGRYGSCHPNIMRFKLNKCGAGKFWDDNDDT